jgi:hypothetical protein
MYIFVNFTLLLYYIIQIFFPRHDDWREIAVLQLVGHFSKRCQKPVPASSQGPLSIIQAKQWPRSVEQAVRVVLSKRKPVEHSIEQLGSRCGEPHSPSTANLLLHPSSRPSWAVLAVFSLVIPIRGSTIARLLAVEAVRTEKSCSETYLFVVPFELGSFFGFEEY